MNKNQFVQASAIFIVLAIAGLLMILVPYQIELDQAETVIALQNSLPLIGSAMLGGGLAFFLLEMTRLERQKSS